MLRVYTDGAVNPKTLKAGVGIVVVGQGIYEQISIPLNGKSWDNHATEWQAVILALEWLISNQSTDPFILLHTDSKVVADSLEKRYSKNKAFENFLNACVQLLSEFKMVEVKWIPEKKNRGADQLARHALRK